MASILEQIAQKNAQIQSLRSQLPDLQKNKDDWYRQSLVPCTQSLKSKKQACIEDKAFKAGRAKYYATQIDSVNLQITNLTKEINLLNDTQVASNSANVNLSTQGVSLEAETIKAEGQAEALAIAASGQSQAMQIKAGAEASTTVSEAEAKKKMMMIIGIIAAVIALIILILVIKKMKSKKSKK